MDSQTETYYAAFFDMFDGMGWKQLMREHKDLVRSAEEKIFHAQTWEETLYYRGRRDQLQAMVNLADEMELLYNQAKEDEAYANADS